MNWLDRIQSLLEWRDLGPAMDLLGTCEDDADEDTK